jgi:predicted nucleotide-binding protein
METNSVQTPSQPLAPQPILDKLQRIHSRGLEILNKEKFPRGEAYGCLRVLFETLRSLYGPTQPLVKLFREKVFTANKNGISQEEFEAELLNLRGLIDQLEYTAGKDSINPVSSPSIPPSGSNVFIIHGHDELNTRRLVSLLQDHFQIKPIVIFEKPGMSRTIIDKYEQYASSCSFAFSLVTPDDEVVDPKGSYKQARPNVIFELGWFVGRLGRQRVVILLKEGTRIHSDIDGVSRIQFRDNIEDKILQIKNELEACGLIK